MKRIASFSFLWACSVAVFPLDAVVAQQAEPPAQAPAAQPQELPEMVVETAPAKRNVKKAALKKSGGTAAPVEPGEVSDAPLPGIVVEGEKVLRSLSATTTSVGIVTGQQIKDMQIQDLQEALKQTANTVAPEGSRGNSGFSIRGLNSEGLTQGENPLSAPLISVVIDGATQNAESTRRGARALWDVDQVEVLRGPQSTLQSRNSLAGTVFIKTNDPTYKLSALVEGTTGTNDLKTGGFVLNTPIVANQSALRLSGYISESDRDISYTDPRNNDLDDDRLENLRAKLLLEPDSVPGLSILLTAARTEDRPAVNAVTGPDFFERVFASDTSAVDFRDTTTNNYISDVSYQVARGYTLRSITAYADTGTEIDTAAGSTFFRDDSREGSDFTQDLRLEIENQGNGLSGVLGLFYGSFKTDTDSLITNDFGFGHLLVQDLLDNYETESIAAYADLHYRFLDRFVLIAGGRLLRDEVSSRNEGTALDFDALGMGVIAYVPVSEINESEFNEALPKVGLTYDLTRDQTIGITYSKGYRPGFSQITLTGEHNDVDPEFLDAYELSYRSQWANRTFDLNGNVFYYDYTNQQVAQLIDPSLPATRIVNAGSSHSYGAEIEARWRPIAPLQMFASVGLLKTEFDEFVTSDGDFGGNEFPDAPGFTLAAGAMYKSKKGWFAGANVRYVDGYYSGGDGELSNDPLRLVDGYTTVDARVGWEWEHYTLTLFAKNLLDEEYITSVIPAQFGNPAEATVGDERLVGVTLQGRF